MKGCCLLLGEKPQGKATETESSRVLALVGGISVGDAAKVPERVRRIVRQTPDRPEQVLGRLTPTERYSVECGRVGLS